MADPVRDDDDTRVRRDDGATTGVPRWVKVFAAVAVAVAVMFVIMFLMRGPGGGEHGPGQHGSSGDLGARATVQSQHR